MYICIAIEWQSEGMTLLPARFYDILLILLVFDAHAVSW